MMHDSGRTILEPVECRGNDHPRVPNLGKEPPMALVVGIDLGRKSAHDVAISDRRPVVRYSVGSGSYLPVKVCANCSGR